MPDAEEEPSESSDEDEFRAMTGMLDHYPGNEDIDEATTWDVDSNSAEESLVPAYYDEVDPKLVNAGWTFKAAKSVEHGKIDQSLVNHVRNGITALARVNGVIESFGGTPYDQSELRDAAALFVIHDVHKLEGTRDADPKRRFDIPTSEIERFVKQFNLLEWAESLEIADFHSCAVDHHNDWTANHDQSTIRFDEYRPLVRLADAFASCETPEAATTRSVTQTISAAYPGASIDLRRHVIDDVKGVLTNLINAAIADTLTQKGYETLLIYQDGCVYLSPDDEKHLDFNDGFVRETFENLKDNVRNSNPAYQDSAQLSGNLSILHAQNAYKINDQDFFYAGAETVLRAVALKGCDDADPDSDPTDSMESTMAELETYLPFDIDRTREPAGLARLAYTVKRTFVDPVIDEVDAEESGLTVTCDVFGVSDDVCEGLETAAEDLSLTAGGKWDYAYGIGQALLNEGVTGYKDLTERVTNNLDHLADDWREIVETEHAGNLQSELDAYLRDIISVDGRMVTTTGKGLTDPFDEYPGGRRGKTCVLCNRGTTGTKGDMKAPKSLTTLQAGYSNHIAVDAGKPDELLTCYPCQIEFSLRETGSGRRESGALWIHCVPDYFYTPLSWRRYSSFVQNFTNEACTELSRLSEAVLRVGVDHEDDEHKVLGSYVAALLDNETGRTMIETLDQGFDPGKQYGSRTISYSKPKDNDTEFQFFGVFVALALAAYTGLRVDISESPIPDIRGRDFRTFARVGGGFTQVQDFYGSEIPLSELQSRLRAAAALIQLGYGADRDDALFAKYLRATRNKFLPGSYLLKRLAQADDGRAVNYLLEEARILDREDGRPTDT